MKTKFLTRLLTGALFVASVSSFVSCKDYDDEINNLQNQINKAALQEDLNSLSSTLTTSIRNAKAAADAAQETAEDAFSAAMLANANAEGRVSQAQFDAVVAEIKAAADKTGLETAAAIKTVAEAAEKATTSASNAQTTADAAQAAANAAQKAANDAAGDAAAAKVAADKAQKTADDAAAAVVLLAAQVADGYATKEDLEKAETQAKQAAEAAALAKQAAATAQKAADDALKSAKDYADKAAKEAADEAYALAVKAAQAAADIQIKAAITEALKNNNLVDIPSDLKEQLENLAKLQEEVTKANSLKETVDELKEKLGGLTEMEDLEGKLRYIETLKTQIKELFQAVTSVELIGTYTGRVSGAKRLNNQGFVHGHIVDFLHGKMATNEWFGNDESRYKESLTGPYKLIKADDSIRYTLGGDIRSNNILLVRVNPVTASFNASQVKLMDSQKNDLSEIVTIGDPYRYTGLITRAQTSIETGLWCIPVSVKPGVTKRVFNRQVYDGGDFDAKNNIINGRQKAYAVAITNTQSDEARYCASTYDIATRYVDYEPANFFNPVIEGYRVRDPYGYADGYQGYNWGIHNRWGMNVLDENVNVRKDGIAGEDSRNRVFDAAYRELAWAAEGKPYAVPNATNTVPAGKYPYTGTPAYDALDPFIDYRLPSETNPAVKHNKHNKVYKPLEVEVGMKFTISNINDPQYTSVYELSRSRQSYIWKTNSLIEYYYVTLDLNNAIESNPSERNAWNSYSIKGLNTMTQGNDDLDMVIESESAAGDWIGFRIFAVNYDGTLVDPDGIAFYVHVAGDEPKKAVKEVPFTATFADATWGDHEFDKFEENTGTLAIDASGFTSLALGSAVQSKTVTIEGDFYYGASQTHAPVQIHYELLDASGNAATNWRDIASIKVGVDHPEYLLDGQTSAEFTIEGRDNNIQDNPILNELTFAVKKNMPTTAPASAAIKWLTTLGPDENNGLINIYPRPYGWLRYQWDYVTNSWKNNYDSNNTYNNPTYWSIASSIADTDWNPASHTSDVYWGTTIAPTSGEAYDGLYPLGSTVFRLATNLNTHNGTALNVDNASLEPERHLYRIEIANASDYNREGNKLYIPGKSRFVDENGGVHLGRNYVDMIDARNVTTMAQIDAATSVKTTPANYSMYVPAKYIDNNLHATKVYYYYKDISLTLNNDGGVEVFVKANYEVPMAATFNTRILDMMQRYNYFARSYSYVLVGDGTTAHPNKTVAVDTYIIKYSETIVSALWSQTANVAWGGSDYGTPVYTNSVGSNLVSLITGQDDSRASELLGFYGYTITPTVYSTARLYDVTVSASSSIMNYYTLSGTSFTTLGTNSATNLVLAKKPGLTPTGDFTGIITITGKDIFGKTISVNIPVKVMKYL